MPQLLFPAVRRTLKTALPRPALHLWRRVVHGWIWGARSNAEVFTRVYARHLWGGTAAERFHSGAGSRDAAVVRPYLDAMRTTLSALEAELGRKPDMVDIGCGDFHVGAQVRPFCARYTACDVVPALIDHHRDQGLHPDVTFRVLDIALEPAPRADVICVRQVFQHLGNEDIAAALPNITGSARWLVISEHVPDGDFIPNRPKPPGPVTRLDAGSGVDLAAAPFGLRARNAQVICDVAECESGGRVVTTLYTLDPAV
jgi:hypothetical protein